MISLVYEIFVFIWLSILFFWFINYQLYKIDPNNYIVIGNPSNFEFLYYSIKNIAFSGIDVIKPLSSIAKIIEVAEIENIS